MRKVNAKEENYSTFLLIDDAINMAKILINDDIITFDAGVDSDIPITLYGNKSKVKEAVVDLILNVSKYNPGDKISLKYSVKKVNNKVLLVVSASSNGNVFSLTIPQDIGIFDKIKILVVDDDIMNIKILKRFLKDSDLYVDSALSGKECLNKLKDNNYSLILIDHMMPEMDGIELLKKIRLNPLYDKLCTIALTANVEKGAKEFYISNGFNDYLKKPILRKELNEMLTKYLPEDFNTFLNRESSKRLKTEAAKSNLKFKYINFSKGMTYAGNDVEIYKKILNVYIDTGGQKVREIKKMYDNEDWENYVILVHALKGTSAGIGADMLSEMLKLLERAGKANDIDYIKSNHSYAMKLYEEVMKDIKKNISNKCSEEKIKKREIVYDEFASMSQQLKSDVYLFYIEEALDIVNELKMCTYNGKDIGEKLAPLLENLIGNYRLDEAETVINMLIDCLN